ncbi:ribonuclease H family protein [Thalassotalea piscium]
MAKKHYVVWKGAKTGVFDNWSTVQSLTSGRPDAQFMGFPSKDEAEAAFKASYTKALMNRSKTNSSSTTGSNTRSATSKAASSSLAPSIIADVQIYCDGACSPNPGKSGTGVAVYQDKKLIELWYGLYNANGTNNTAELNGLLAAFKLAKQYLAKGKHVQILSDSKYSIDSITKWAAGWKNKGWKKANGEAIKNPELVKACFTLYQEIKNQITISHVKGHANNEGNELSDRMAVYARKNKEIGLVRYTDTLDIRTILAMESG